jgi:hypothetical protein
MWQRHYQAICGAALAKAGGDGNPVRIRRETALRRCLKRSGKRSTVHHEACHPREICHIRPGALAMIHATGEAEQAESCV